MLASPNTPYHSRESSRICFISLLLLPEVQRSLIAECSGLGQVWKCVFKKYDTTFWTRELFFFSREDRKIKTYELRRDKQKWKHIYIQYDSDFLLSFCLKIEYLAKFNSMRVLLDAGLTWMNYVVCNFFFPTNEGELY